MPIIGSLLSTHRFMKKLTVREFSKELGISAATLSRIENGGKMDSDTMLKLIDWMFK